MKVEKELKKQEWAWLQHPGLGAKIKKKRRQNDGQAKKTTEAPQLPTPLLIKIRVWVRFAVRSEVRVRCRIAVHSKSNSRRATII